jgi:glycosyltransferase involved in cell wall biosynthesis
MSTPQTDTTASLPVTGVIFSKDRPLQLDATLRSFKRHCQDADNISVKVIYAVSSPRLLSLYRQLMLDYPTVDFVREQNFRRDLLVLLKGREYVLFLVDDNVFVRDFTMADIIQALRRHPDAIGFSLRLGRNTTYCYAMNKSQKLPEFQTTDGATLKFHWPDAELDFNYPLEVSSSMYRTNEVAALLESLDFKNPNTLEAAMAGSTARFLKTHPYLLCPEHSLTFCIPVNMVQQVCTNRVSANPAYSAEALEKLFSEGQRIDVEALDGFKPQACHQETDLKLFRATTPAVSVIILCHNYARYLPEAVASVWNQTFRNFEIIVVDDGSTDDSLAVAHRLASETHSGIPFRVVHLHDVGPTKARRLGAEQARGKYILPLDADDRIAPDFLAKTEMLLEADPKLGFAYVDTVFFGDREQRHHQPEYDYDRLCRENFISYCSLIRIAAFDDVGGYDAENWGYYEDWDLWIRLGTKGWFGRHIPEPLFFYRHHFDSSLSLFACRLDPAYKAFLYSRRPELYTKAIIASARQKLSEMPLDWNIRPPMRNIEHLKSLASQHPQNRHVLYFLGCALGKHGARAEAEAVFKNLLTKHPNDIQAREALKQLPVAAQSTNQPTSAPKVSVIVPTYCRPDGLAEALRSILNQTFRDFEILVVNDAGLDVEYVVRNLHAGQEIVYLRHPANKGLAAARNTGLRFARGKYVAYLDDDDIFLPDHLETLVRFLESTGKAVAYTDAFCARQKFDQIGSYAITERTVLYSYDWDNDRILYENFVPVLCFMHQLACVHTVGNFDESLTTHEDWDMWIRLSRKYEMTHIKKVTCEFRLRDDGTSMTSGKRSDFARTLRFIYKKYRAFAKGKSNVLKKQDEIRHLLPLHVDGKDRTGIKQIIHRLLSPKWRRSVRKRLPSVSEWFED